MEHDDIRERLSDFLDGELGPEEHRSVSEHLAGCGECRQALEQWRRLSRALFRKPAQPTRAETEVFVSRVMGGIPSQEPAWPAFRWFAPALGLSFAAFVLSFTLPSQELEDPSTTLGSEVAEWVSLPEPGLPLEEE